jgi:hypothetical protein
MILITGSGPNKRNVLRAIAEYYNGQPVEITIDPGAHPKAIGNALRQIAEIIEVARSLEYKDEDEEDERSF